MPKAHENPVSYPQESTNSVLGAIGRIGAAPEHPLVKRRLEEPIRSVAISALFACLLVIAPGAFADGVEIEQLTDEQLAARERVLPYITVQLTPEQLYVIAAEFDPTTIEPVFDLAMEDVYGRSWRTNLSQSFIDQQYETVLEEYSAYYADRINIGDTIEALYGAADCVNDCMDVGECNGWMSAIAGAASVAFVEAVAGTLSGTGAGLAGLGGALGYCVLTEFFGCIHGCGGGGYNGFDPNSMCPGYATCFPGNECPATGADGGNPHVIGWTPVGACLLGVLAEEPGICCEPDFME